MRLFRACGQQVAAIQAAFEELATLLRTHAAQEETRLEPQLNDRDTAAAGRLLREHHRLDAELDRLSAFVRGLDASSAECADALLRLHLDWNRFLGAYLLHLDEEERNLFVGLAEQTPLAAIAQSAFAQGAEGQRFLDRLWSVTTPAERVAIEHAHADVISSRAGETACC
jgi:hypothetical protein